MYPNIQSGEQRKSCTQDSEAYRHGDECYVSEAEAPRRTDAQRTALQVRVPEPVP